MRPIPSNKGSGYAANTDNVLGSMRELGTLPVFDYYTATVQRARSPAEVVEAVESLPVIAIGGISLENVSRCLQHGAAGVAAIGLLNDSNNLAATVRSIREAI